MALRDAGGTLVVAALRATAGVLAAAALAAGTLWLAGGHRVLLLRAYGWLSTPAPLSAPPALDPGVRWHDDYYSLEALDDRTWAIGEPRYAQRNFSFLILGRTRGVLFDAGPGVRQLATLVASLTDLPVVFFPSHLHYDHVGGARGLERVALLDLPWLRAQAATGTLTPDFAQHLGAVEGIEPPLLAVAEWWRPGSVVELGGRRLEVWHTPGHTPESASLYDRERGWLFAGDLLYPGELYAFVPGASLADYLWTSERVAGEIAEQTAVFGGHGSAGSSRAPALGSADLRDLQQALRQIRRGERRGEGLFPRIYAVNERLSLAADGIAGDWTPRASPAR